MDYLISRDQGREVILSLAMTEAILNGRSHHENDMAQTRIISRFLSGA